MSRLNLRWLFGVQALLLAVAAWRNLHQLNPDAVAYIRIADYYAGGRWELAVTGYWGPLLSWLMMPLLKAGAAPLVAARVVMALSGVVFLCGAIAVFRVFRLPRVALLTGSGIAAAWSVVWSVRHITPDLLMAGLVALAVSATVKAVLTPCRRFEITTSREQRTSNAATASRRHEGATRRAIAAGMWWGLAYLAKAVALPLAGLTTAGLSLFALGGCGELRREMAQRLGLVWLCTALIAAPWIGVLSLHYGKFTFSTTGPIAHALAGPGEPSRYHPAMVTLHQPDAGRVTQWEEPSRMTYRFWSPFASEENLRHQLAVAARNTATLTEWLWGVRWLSGADDSREAARLLPGFDLLGLSLAGVVGGVVVLFAHRRRPRCVRWSWAVVPMLGLGGLYLPFFVMAEDNRYFHAALPFVWVLVIGAWGWASREHWEWARRIRPTVFRVAAWAFLIPPALWLGVALHGIPNAASHAAHELAAQWKSSGSTGPIAGSGLLPGGRVGLYTAFLLGERWLGDDPLAGPAEFAAVGARMVVLRRGAPAAEAFARDPRWRPSGAETSASLRVFVQENP